MKKILIGLMLATSTIVAMIGSANAALYDSSQHSIQVPDQKNYDSVYKNAAETQQAVKPQPTTKIVQKTDQSSNKKQPVKTDAITSKKPTAQQPSKPKDVTSDHESKGSKYAKNYKS